MIWKYRDSTSANPLYIIIDNNYNIYVTGYKGARMCTVKYSQPIGIKKISSNIPKEYNLSQNYPNPFNPTTKIKFQIVKSGLVQLQIFDVLGRKISSLVNELLKPGDYEIEWNGTNFPSGIYFYQLKTNKFTQTKKMILMK
jgi:hypothetical protein